MGLRGKIVALFLVSFGLMVFLAAALLKNDLEQAFLDIANKQALEQMQQLTRNLDGELDRLNQLVFDWGNWDDLYIYATHPNKEFIDRQAGAVALKEIDVKYLAVLDAHGQTLVSESANLMNGQLENPAAFLPVLENIKKRVDQPSPASDKTCGIDLSTAGPLLVCWKAIRRSDLTGDSVGTIVLGRLLNSALLSRIQTQSNINFSLSPLPIHKERPPDPPKNSIEAEQVAFSVSEPGVLNAVLNNFLGQPILKVRLQFPPDLSVSGAALIWQVLRVLLPVMLLTGLVLLAGVYWIAISRLRKIETELGSIWRNGRWAGRLELPVRKDEINDLSHTINRMLALIRKQMVMLDAIALTDPLTQIGNRRAFDERIAIELSLYKRNETPLSLLIIDLDYFRRYNDLHGHSAGDEVLKAVGQLLGQVACRPSDLPARISGERFGVILPATDLDGACHVAEQFRGKLAELNLAHGDSPIGDLVTLSIGVTTAGSEEVEALLQRAEKALYSAKQAGRNRISVLPAR